MFRFQYANSCSDAKEFILSYLLPRSSSFRPPHIITTIIESDQVNECLIGNTPLLAVWHTEISVLQPFLFLFFFPWAAAPCPKDSGLLTSPTYEQSGLHGRVKWQRGAVLGKETQLCGSISPLSLHECTVVGDDVTDLRRWCGYEVPAKPNTHCDLKLLS